MSEQQFNDLVGKVARDLVFIPISKDLYSELEAWSKNDGGPGGLATVAAIADHQLRFFLERISESGSLPEEGVSFYWQDPNSRVVLELPHGTELRTRYKLEWRVAKVDDGIFVWEGKAYSSPSKVCNAMRGGTNNNAWMELSIKRPSDPEFRSANKFRP